MNFLKNISPRLNHFAQTSASKCISKSKHSTATVQFFEIPKNERREERKQENQQKKWLLLSSVPAFALGLFTKSDNDDLIVQDTTIDFNILYVSLKMAQLNDAQGKSKEAKSQYIWTIEKLDEKQQQEPDNKDLNELWAIVNSSYGKFLLKNGNYAEAKERLGIAYDAYVVLKGKTNKEVLDILNNLAFVCSKTKEFDTAEAYIEEALIVAVNYPELLETGIYHANKGLILLKRQFWSGAGLECKHAESLSKKSKNAYVSEKSKYCLEQVENALKKEKAKNK